MRRFFSCSSTFPHDLLSIQPKQMCDNTFIPTFHSVCCRFFLSLSLFFVVIMFCICLAARRKEYRNSFDGARGGTNECGMRRHAKWRITQSGGLFPLFFFHHTTRPVIPVDDFFSSNSKYLVFGSMGSILIPWSLSWDLRVWSNRKYLYIRDNRLND